MVRLYLKNLFSLKSTFVLMYLSLFSLALTVARIAFTQKNVFLFMVWNLFLAFVPWLLSSFLYFHKIKNNLLCALIIFVWMLFFPNAPYVLTDLLHLRKDLSVPVWYDFIMLLSYAFTGLLYAFVSLNFIEIRLNEKYKPAVIKILVYLMIYVSSFGVYIGRFLRWNSWDVFANPVSLFSDVYERITSPGRHLSAWLFTFLLGTLLNLVYAAFKQTGRTPDKP